ncbi:MAG: adenosylmethionine decarboxylase [Candidatus Hadarchaeales archaeon]
MIVGRHIVAELYGVEERLIAKRDEIEKLLEEVVKKAKLTRVGSIFKQFRPKGVTAVVLISESHISLHTWPEYGLVNLDIFTCGDPSKAEKVFELILKRLKPKSYRRVVLDRG